jgi:hypothetical protein
MSFFAFSWSAFSGAIASIRDSSTVWTVHGQVACQR